EDGVVDADEQHILLHIEADGFVVRTQHARDLVKGSSGADDADVAGYPRRGAAADGEAVTVQRGKAHFSLPRLDEAALEHGPGIVLRAAKGGARNEIFEVFGE